MGNVPTEREQISKYRCVESRSTKGNVFPYKESDSLMVAKRLDHQTDGVRYPIINDKSCKGTVI